MGSTESIMSDVELGEALPDNCQLYKMWTEIYPGLYRESQKVSVFVRDFSETDSVETRNFFENGMQTLRQLRHPSIVSFCTSECNKTEAALVTERMQPLDLALDDLEPVEIMDGLKNILYALIFLHDKAGRSHNNVCPSAVFISPSGEWKLGSFECSQRLENSRHWVVTDFAKTVKEAAFLPPEDQQIMQKDAPLHARDSYGFGKLVEYLMPYAEQIVSEEQKTELQELIDILGADEASRRPELGAYEKSHALSNELSDVSEFLRLLPVKSSEEKTQFFRNLVPRLESLPAAVLARRLLKLLLSRYVLLEYDAVRYVLPSILTVQQDASPADSDVVSLLSKPLFERYVVPELSRIFAVHESSVRLSLLAYFDRYIVGFDTDVLEEIVLPELLTGMKDTDERIVSASMRALADLVPLLGAATVTGLTHKKYFADGKPRDKTATPILENVSNSLKNIKQALEQDSSLNELEQERKELRRLKMEERRRLMETKRKERMQNKATIAVKTAPQQDEAKSEPTETTDPTIESKTDNESEPDWAEWQNDVPEQPSPAPVVQPDTVSAPAPIVQSERRRSQRSSVGDRALGAEFDVMALDVDNVKTNDPMDNMDFFSDMEPTFTNQAIKKKSSLTSAAPTNMFQMALADTTDVWDEAAWEDED